jgi:hypothetical protein
MQVELTAEDLKYIRAALTLVIFEREELIETGRLAKELGENIAWEAARESADYEEKMRALIAKLPE